MFKNKNKKYILTLKSVCCRVADEKLGNPEIFGIRSFPNTLTTLEVKGFLIRSCDLVAAFSSNLSQVRCLILQNTGRSAKYGVNAETIRKSATIQPLNFLNIVDFNYGNGNAHADLLHWVNFRFDFLSLKLRLDMLSINCQHSAHLVLKTMFKSILTEEDKNLLKEVFIPF